MPEATLWWGSSRSQAGVEGSSNQYRYTIAHSQYARTLCRSISSGVLAAEVLGCRQKGLAWEGSERESCPGTLWASGKTGQQSKEELNGGI